MTITQEQMKEFLGLIISNEMIQDCYMYNNIDAPSEIKIMVLEYLANEIDKFILGYGKPEHMKEDIRSKLNKIEIRYKE